VEYCKAKKLTKQCPYEKKTKYLVLTSDKVENLACHSPFLKIIIIKKYIHLSNILSRSFCIAMAGENKGSSRLDTFQLDQVYIEGVI